MPGAQDSFIAARRADLPDAELHLLEGIGHVPVFTAPATEARRMDTRFTQVGVAAA